MFWLIIGLITINSFSQDTADTKDHQPKTVRLSGASGSTVQAARQDESVLVDEETAAMLRQAVKDARRSREAYFLAQVLIGWENWHHDEVLDDCNHFQMKTNSRPDYYDRDRCLMRHNLIS